MKIKYLNSFLAVIAFWVVIVQPLLGQGNISVDKVLNPKNRGGGYVSDADNILSSADIQTLNSLISSLENTTSAQVAVVLLQSIGDQNPKDFSTKLFNHWGIGQAENDNGLLIFTVMDQRRTEFETGYGLEGVLPDVVCYRIGMQELVPYFREGQYGKGLIAAVERIKTILEDPETAEEIYVDPSNRSNGRNKTIGGIPTLLFIYLAISLIFGIAIIARIITILRSKEEAYDKYIALSKNALLALIFIFPLPYLLIYFFLKNRMNYFRNMPRFSRINGNPMHKLNEEEDDSFLSKGQITEEEIGSVDYDVWVTENEDDVLILRYAHRFSKYSNCQKCGFKTFSQDRTEILRHATYSSSGSKRIISSCKNCNYRKVHTVVIPRKTRSSSGGGSGGGSSWGGGSSGGGGAGVSW